MKKAEMAKKMKRMSQKGRGSLNIPAKDKGGENPVMEGKNEHNRA